MRFHVAITRGTKLVYDVFLEVVGGGRQMGYQLSSTGPRCERPRDVNGVGDWNLE